MQLLINLLITAAIIGLAGWEIFHHLQKARQANCPGCDCGCALKRQATQKRH